MASALSENPASVIHSLNLAHNALDNQGNNLQAAESSFLFLLQLFLTDHLPLLWLVMASRALSPSSRKTFFISLIYFLH